MHVPVPRSLLRTACVAGVLSGVPSTVITLVRGESLLESTRAAGSLLGRETVAAGSAAHAGITLWWTAVLRAVLPRRQRLLWGAAAGGAIAALDLGVVGRRYPALARLDPVPQVLDHLAFGLTVAWLTTEPGASPPRRRW